MSLAYPPSHCPLCKSLIPYYFNIPLLGYLFRRGKCHQCKGLISPLYPVTELCCMLLVLLAGWLWGADIKTLSAALLWCGLLVLSIIDERNGYLPDQITLSLLWLGLLFNTVNLWVGAAAAVWGACLGYLIMAGINALYKTVRKREGLGGGDMKLYAALGAFLGWQSLLPILLLASIAGCFFAACKLLITRKKISQIAFGPFLALAGFFYMLLISKGLIQIL